MRISDWSSDVCSSDLIERMTGGFELRLVQPAFAIGTGKSRRMQQAVAFAQRHVEQFRQMQRHLPARPGTSGFEKADMALRDAAGFGQFELNQAPAAAPLPHERTETVARGIGHCDAGHALRSPSVARSEEPTSELQS